MGLLSTRALTRMRAAAVNAMSQQGYVLTRSGAPLNQAGGRSASASNWTQGPLTPCRLWRQRDFASEGDEAAITQSTARYKLSLPFGTAIDPTDRFQIEGGQVFEVAGVMEAHADAIQVICDVILVS